jgi:uncharacterized membrane protein
MPRTQWLRKAILRASGLKALHDEDEIYRQELAERQAASWGADRSTDTASRLPFNGVFLEGLEVAFTVVTFGAAQHRIGVAALGAAAALVLVLVVGAAVHRPLGRVPENTLKFGVEDRTVLVQLHRRRRLDKWRSASCARRR